MEYAIQHYENFPVASVLLPRRLRYPIRVIYAFARQADDFADEGEVAPAQRLAALQEFRRELDHIAHGGMDGTPLFRDLANVIRRHQLPMSPFYDLLDAFSQDVTKTRYAHFGEVMDYCRRSANPIGRLLLQLYGAADTRRNALSDGICSALQIINFLQDIALDFDKGRIYLPQDEMNKFGITEAQIASADTGGLWWAFMQMQIDRARKLLQAGAPLGRQLNGRLGLEMRMIIMGGERILKKIHASQGDIYRARPMLKPHDWLYMFYRALRAT